MTDLFLFCIYIAEAEYRGCESNISRLSKTSLGRSAPNISASTVSDESLLFGVFGICAAWGCFLAQSETNNNKGFV